MKINFNEPSLPLTIKCSKFFITSILASFYALAFIITPYWTLAQSNSSEVIILIFTVSFGILWSLCSGSEIQVQISVRRLTGAILLVLFVILLNYKALTSVIPWRGDEDFHILKTLEVITLIPNSWFLEGVLLFGLILYLSWRKSYWAFIVGGLTIAGIILLFKLENPLNGLKPDFLLRYPFINYWFYSIIPRMASAITDPYHEILYRIIPAISAAAIIWLTLPIQEGSPRINLLLWCLAIATIPVLFYYTSIFYLELPAIGLMLIVCLQLKGLLEDDFNAIKSNPSWYALLIIGFIKETVLPFLVCFLLIRLIYSIRRVRLKTEQEKNVGFTIPSNWHMVGIIGGEIMIAFSILFPLFFYLYLRNSSSPARGYSPNIENLFDLTIYRVMGHALIDQFGISLAFFLIGCVYLLNKKHFYTVLFLLTAFIFNALFYLLDNKAYVGYSRYNLFLLPPILASSKYFISQISRKHIFMALGIISLAIAMNLYASPINLDGTKKPLWGSYLIDTAEHYYPYREALIWLKENHPNDKILVTGMYYPYFSLEFYFNRLNWHPQYTQLQIGDETDYARKGSTPKYSIENIPRILTQAEQSGYSVVLYHDLEGQIPPIQSVGNFQLAKVAQNQAHILLIYYEKP